MFKPVKNIASFLLLALITFYRYVISPVTGSNCRYHPSCSAYAQLAIREHGPVTGSKLAILRILSCRPGMAGGYDPVPCSSMHQDNRNTLSNPESAR